jgi:hypothetical protein
VTIFPQDSIQYYCHPNLGHPSRFLPSDFQTKIVYVFLISFILTQSKTNTEEGWTDVCVSNTPVFILSKRLRALDQTTAAAIFTSGFILKFINPQLVSATAQLRI